MKNPSSWRLIRRKCWRCSLVALLPAAFLLPGANCRADATVHRLGVSLALSGPNAEYGSAVQNGIQFALDENPDIKQRLLPIFEDDRYDPKTTVSNLQKLADIDGIEMLLVWGNESALAAAPVAEGRKLPTVVVAQHPKSGAGFKYVFRFINPAEDYSKSMLNYLRTQGTKHFLAIKTEISFFNILLDEFQNGLQANESLSVYESFAVGDSDFRTTIAKLKQQTFDMLGVYLNPPQSIQFFRQAVELGFHPQVFGSTPFESKAVIKEAGGYIDGSVYSQLGVDESFRERYIKRFGDDIQIAYAANAYDFVSVADKALRDLPSHPAAEKVLDALAKSADASGMCGPHRYRVSEKSGKFFEFDIVVKKIEGSKIVILGHY